MTEKDKELRELEDKLVQQGHNIIGHFDIDLICKALTQARAEGRAELEAECTHYKLRLSQAEAKIVSLTNLLHTKNEQLRRTN